MRFELNEYRHELSDDEILEDIKNVAKGLGTDFISFATYHKYGGKYSLTAIQGHFGKWTEARTLAGLRSKLNADERKRITDEAYYADLMRVAHLIGSDTVPEKSYEKFGNHPCGNIYKRFGKWNTALKKAGLKETGFSKDRISEQQCFDEIERMWETLGRQPTTTDLIKGGISLYSIDTFKRRFGGWRNALKAFVEYKKDDDANVVSSKETNNEGTKEKQVDQSNLKSQFDSEDAIRNTKGAVIGRKESKKCRTSRNPTTSLRYTVLTRDNYKCCACGASPAKDPSVELQVDHIIPWSKGGETELDNLQTLCSKCNLGKSDLL